MSQSFGERLKQARVSLSLTELARKADVSERSLYGWENGERLPRPRQLQALATALGVNPDWLETGEGEQYPPQAPQEGYRIEYFDDLGIRSSLDAWLHDTERQLVWNTQPEEADWLRAHLFKLEFPPTARLWETLLMEYRRWKLEQP